MEEGVQLPWPGTLGHDWHLGGHPWKRGWNFLGQAFQDLTRPGLANHGRGGAVSLAWHPRACLVLNMPGMDDRAQLPWPGSRGPGRSWGAQLLKSSHSFCSL